MLEVLDNLSYAKTIHKVLLFEPTEACEPCISEVRRITIKVLISSIESESKRSKLMRTLDASLSEFDVVLIEKRYFSTLRGHQYLRRLVIHEKLEALQIALSGKNGCTASFAAVTDYLLETSGLVFANHTLNVNFQTLDGIVSIDHASARHLELINDRRKFPKDPSLFGKCFLPVVALLTARRSPSTNKDTDRRSPIESLYTPANKRSDRTPESSRCRTNHTGAWSRIHASD